MELVNCPSPSKYHPLWRHANSQRAAISSTTTINASLLESSDGQAMIYALASSQPPTCGCRSQQFLMLLHEHDWEDQYLAANAMETVEATLQARTHARPRQQAHKGQ